MPAVVNSGPLIVLAKLNHLHLLARLYGEVLVPKGVYDEVVVEGQALGYADATLIGQLLVREGWTPIAVSEFGQPVLESRYLGQGEREAIFLASERQVPLLTDDRRARQVGREMGLETLGSLGVLVAAYRSGFLAAEMLDELLLTIDTRDDIWIDSELCRRVRREIINR
ncbi:MAG: hypothetical protein ACUVWR_09185 [Anaerolineae bacterium]